MRMEAQDAQYARHAHEIAFGNALQVRNSPEPPILDLLWREQFHPDKDIDRGHHFALCQDRRDYALDPREHFVIPKRRHGHDRMAILWGGGSGWWPRVMG